MENLLKILAEIRPEFDFEESENFIIDGLLDSFDVVALVANLDSRYFISINGEDIIPENFSSLSSIESLLNKYGVRI
jgi:acyl carrier protein